MGDVTDQHLSTNPRPNEVWQVGIALKRRGEIAHYIRQRDPELYAMQHWRLVRLGDLAVHDAVTGSHDIELARPYCRPGAEAVAMFNLAVQQPFNRLQSGVRRGPALHT